MIKYNQYRYLCDNRWLIRQLKMNRWRIVRAFDSVLIHQKKDKHSNTFITNCIFEFILNIIENK